MISSHTPHPQVAGPQNRHMRRWHLPPGSLAAIGSGGRQHELLKQIRLLVVAYDNMDQQTRAHLASTAEVRLFSFRLAFLGFLSFHHHHHYYYSY